MRDCEGARIAARMNLTMQEGDLMSKGCLKCGTENASDARFCRHCGTPLAAPAIAAEPARPITLWIGLGLLAVALAGGGLWWLKQSRSPAVPTFDSAPPPSVLGADSPASAPAAASAPAGTLWEPAGKETAITEHVEKPVPVEAETAKDSPRETARSVAREKAARDAKARALREQRAQAASQAEADLARRRADEARARAAQAPAAPTPVPRAQSPASPPVQARTVQERCAGLNPLAKGICEARECVRTEHAGEVVCQRIKAADDRRREQ